MKIYLVRRSYFSFRNVGSGDLDLLGKTVIGRMADELGAEVCDMPPAGEKIVLYPAYPFLKREELEAFISEHEGSVRFTGGFIERGGAYAEAKGFSGGVFTLQDYVAARARAAREIAEYHVGRGVLVENGVEIDCRAKIGRGSAVRRGSKIVGACVIGENAEISESEITESVIGAGTSVKRSVLVSARVGENCTVGPFAYLRPQAEIGNGCRIGDFVEIKNARVGNGTKISHLAYVGDADLGERINVGCGVVFVNYNGKEKFRSEVGSGSFIGSNCNLIAPVHIGENVFLAAGTTLTENLESGDFCVGRSRETVKPHGAEKYLK